jgi:hypothetical protein
MKMRKKLFSALVALALVSGCASNKAAQDYYAAVQTAANAKAQTDTARYEALAKMAAAGGEASVAATMAIALTQPSTITPQYVESSSLKWAQILTPTLGTLGLGIVQAGVAKNASNNAAQVQMASMASNQAIQLGQQDMITNLGGQWSAGAAASGQQLVDLGVAGFGALNTAGDQTVALGTAGLTTATTIATAGFTANENIATVGITGVVDTATIGMDNLNDMGQFGMTTIGALGTAGMTNLLDMSSDYNQTLITTLADANDTNLEGQTNFAQIIADMQATIDSMSAELNDPIVCADDGTGTIVCN